MLQLTCVSCTLSYSCKLPNITRRSATSFLPASRHDFTLPKRITVIFRTHDVSTFIFSVKKKNYAYNHFQLTTTSKPSEPYLTCDACDHGHHGYQRTFVRSNQRVQLISINCTLWVFAYYFKNRG
jgi:hypothetical protein